MKKNSVFPRRFGKSLGMLCLIVCSGSFAQNVPKDLLITTESAFPTNISNDNGKTIFGTSADKVHELLKRSRIPYRMEMMSWNRAFELARTGPDTCVYSTARTKERESDFKWIGPIGSGTTGIFGSPDKLGKVTSIDDIKQGRIGDYLGDVFVSMLSEKGIHAVVSYEPATAIKNVAYGRLDYVAISDRLGEHFISSNHLEEKVTLLFRLKPIDLYLACNRNIDDDTIALMNSKLAEMKKDGTYSKIELKY